MTDTTSAASPFVAPLYFAKCDPAPNSSPLGHLPAELLRHCLVGYADWGDLAKLATVSSSYKSLVSDASEFGGHEAAWELAEALLDGRRGLQTNPKLAMSYLLELANVEISIAENERNEAKIVNENKEPFAPAMQRMADCYFTGTGVDVDTAKGVKWLEAAHALGEDVEAAHKLALVYEYGEHQVEVDVVLAADWFHKAAKGGHVEAMAEYGMCCELGCGREQSDEEALEWYIKAANSGHTTSKYSVGEAFEEAKGVPQSDEEACLWYYKAAVEGDEDSKKALRRLEDIARIVLPGVAGVLDA